MPLDPPLDEPVEAIREALLPLRNGLSVAVHAAGNAFAAGAIIRVCHSYLVKEILLVGTEPHYEKASMGMHRLETVVRLADVDAFFAHVGSRPVWALEREVARRSLDEVSSFPEDVVLYFGSERFGIPPEVLARCHDVLAIPLYGVNNSLPVAVACGITLARWARTRYAPGTIVVGPPR
jgi:tRNA G18 (ribose-2'-O)-methylase SpoU